MDKILSLPRNLPQEISSKFAVDNNTLGREVKSQKEDKIEIQIGDHKQPDFKPQVKLMRWDNEVNFSIRAEEFADAVVKFEGEKVKYVSDKQEVHIYEKPEVSEDGGLEFEWLLKEKPVSNILQATIETKGLDFHYQPPLTAFIIPNRGESLTETEYRDKNGNLLYYRPENIIGTYALYHKSKQNNRIGGKFYKIGKFGHIYRPKAIDASGKEAWCQLFIDVDNKNLQVIVPQEFLDKAIYPIVIDPTFGYTSIPTSTIAWIEDRIGGLLASISENGVGEKITVAIADNGDTGTHNIKCNVYNSDGSAEHANGQTEQKSVGNVVDLGEWIDFNFNSAPSFINGTSYGLVVWASNASGTKYMKSETVGGVSAWTLVVSTYGTWPSSIGSPNFLNTRAGIYCTYSVPATPTLSQHSHQFIDDDGSEQSATLLAGNSANIQRGKNINTRLRTQINATGDPSSITPQLEFRKKTPNDSESWATVTSE